MPAEVSANLLLSSDGRATLNRSSKQLSFPADRSRFHEIRSRAELILIGGNTARCEPYSTTPVPLVVLTRASEIKEVANNSHVTLMNSDLGTVLTLLKHSYAAILIEAGPALVFEGLSLGLIDTLYLSISELTGDAEAKRYELADALSGYQLLETTLVAGGELRRYSLVAPPSGDK